MIIGRLCLLPAMWVVWRLILEGTKRNSLNDAIDLGFAGGRAIGTRKEAKVVVKGVVFLDDEDDVFNRHRHGMFALSLQGSRGGREESGTERDKSANGQD